MTRRSVGIEISPAQRFSLWRTIYSHGWCSLPPFSVDTKKRVLKLTLARGPRHPVQLEIRQGSPNSLQATFESVAPVSHAEGQSIILTAASCLRLDEDYTEFYAQARRHPQFRWVPRTGAGRLLRAPTVFEDVVKMICTTNCSWGLTEVMVGNLCSKLGTPASNGAGEQGAGSTFPTPEAIADTTEKYLRKEIRTGYRAPYLLELARRVASRDLDLESLRASDAGTVDLFDQLRSVKGVGPYAAANILKLLGRYDYLGIDSWCRKQFFILHKNGRKSSDRVIEKFYGPFGKWRGLFFWLDVTRHWLDKKIPF